MDTQKYGDPNAATGTSFVKLHEIMKNQFGLNIAKVQWASGNNDFEALQEVDLTRYLGGFNARVRTKGNAENPPVDLPVLPNWKIVSRKNTRGEKFELYTSPTMRFVLFTARARAVKYKREGKDNKIAKNERGYPVILSVAKTDMLYQKGSGYSPEAEVFGFVVDDKNALATPFIFHIESWSAWKSYYSRETQGNLKNITRKDGFLPVFEIGTHGKKNKQSGAIEPVLVEFNGGWTTPIESFTNNVAHVKITDEMDAIWQASQDWVNCKAWNAIGDVQQEINSLPPIDEAANELFGVPEVGGIPADGEIPY